MVVGLVPRCGSGIICNGAALAAVVGGALGCPSLVSIFVSGCSCGGWLVVRSVALGGRIVLRLSSRPLALELRQFLDVPFTILGRA